MSEQTFQDKSTYAHQDGPWMTEPDRKHWIDEDTGLDCLIVRNGSGALCGYVGVPEGHPWHGKDYDQIPYDDVRVHGGLTFADRCHENGHICHADKEAAHQNVWWLGFDCAHLGDFSPRYEPFRYGNETYKNISYVASEVQSLAWQVSRNAAIGVEQ